jgi:chemotaxis signal transduction protein
VNNAEDKLMAIESQWVTFRVADETFGLEIQYVKEMLRMPQVHAVPSAAMDNLGVMLLRSEVIPVFDLRRKFGLEPRSQRAKELTDLLAERQRDHENWLKELENSVLEKREFTLTTNPHACKFGKWFDSFTTDDASLARIMKRLDEPHKQIHEVGGHVLELEKQGQFEQCTELVQSCELVLHRLIQLFAEAAAQVADAARQSLIVVGTANCTLGVAVDQIESVVRCQDNDIQAPDSIPGIEQFGGLIGLLPQKGSSKFIMLLDPAQIYPQLVAPMPQAALA